MGSDITTKRRIPNVWLIIFGAIFVLLGILASFRQFSLLFTWIKTTAKVASVSRSSDSDSTVYTPTVYYTCWNGIQIIQQSKFSSSSFNYPIWEIVPIYCDPKNPNNFVIFAFSSYSMIIFFIIGVLILWSGILIVFNNYRSQKLKNQLLVTGTKIETVITKIIESTWKINDQSAYRIESTDWKNIYKSKNILADVPEYVSIWDKVVVYRDLIDPKKYLMDVDLILERVKTPAKVSLPKELLEMTTSELIKYRDDQNKLKEFLESNFFFNTLFGWILHGEEVETMRRLIDEEIKKRQS